MQERRGEIAKFEDLVEFVEERAEIATDPVGLYGTDNEHMRKPGDCQNQAKGQQHTQIRPRSVFATAARFPSAHAFNLTSQECTAEAITLYIMEMCRKIRSQPHREKLKFLVGRVLRVLYLDTEATIAQN